MVSNISHPCWNATDPWWAFDEDLNIWRYPQVMLGDFDGTRSGNTLAFGSLLAGLLDQANQWAYTIPTRNADGTDNPNHFSPQNRLVLSWDEIEFDQTRIRRTTDRIRMIRDFQEILEESGSIYEQRAESGE